VQVFFPDVPDLPLPDGHRFPAAKYTMLRRRIVVDGVLGPRVGLTASPAATRADLLLAHEPEYVDRALSGTLSAAEQRAIGLPWSTVLRDRSLATVGGTRAAAMAALRDGFSGQLAGGTHHASSKGGSGFCMFNDIAVASLDLIAAGLVSRIAVVDLDVHQGDGTAAILGRNPAVFTLSIHGENNFPFVKPASSRDIGLADWTEDGEYIERLDGALVEVTAFGPDLVFYIAGADPLHSDRLGRLSLTHAGLALRDQRVFAAGRRAGIPVAVVIGGGYAEPIEDTVTAYVQTFAVARTVFGF
jgi:acetoin utilization deacetylase AcuC-like enzyme